ncbi:hypothetical protein [Saccharopolyspora shandongensis]|uniref:hypothetical protein n=1 Tax=Saccharopolyspora shandongensis TaxID=418495 RepID=UPI0033EABF3B
MAALVDAVESGRTSLDLINLSSTRTRHVIVQSGGFGGDRIDEVHHSGAEAGYPGAAADYAAPPCVRTTTVVAVGDERFTVVLPPGSRVHLDLRFTPRAGRPHHTVFTAERTS